VIGLDLGGERRDEATELVSAVAIDRLLDDVDAGGGAGEMVMQVDADRFFIRHEVSMLL